MEISAKVRANLNITRGHVLTWLTQWGREGVTYKQWVESEVPSSFATATILLRYGFLDVDPDIFGGWDIAQLNEKAIEFLKKEY